MYTNYLDRLAIYLVINFIKIASILTKKRLASNSFVEFFKFNSDSRSQDRLYKVLIYLCY